MQHTFLVGLSASPLEDRAFKLVTAASREAAITRFAADIAPQDSAFRVYVYEKAVNLSFAEAFWLQTEDEVETFAATGAVSIDTTTFAIRVRRFFGEHYEFADRYLDYYLRTPDLIPLNNRFPDEMLTYMWLASDYCNVTAIKLTDIELIE